MRKTSSLLLFMLVIASCGNNAQDPVTDWMIISEAEFKNALVFSNVDFIQIAEKKGSKEKHYECSPTVFYEKGEGEKYIIKEADDKYYQCAQKEEKWYRKKTTKEDFHQPLYFADYLFSILVEAEFKYSDVVCDEGNRQYTWQSKAAGKDVISAVFRFKDKKLVYHSITDKTYNEYSYTYQNQTPTIPHIDVNEYQANATNTDHLVLTKNGIGITNLNITDDEDFVFNARALGENYIVPYSLMIKVDGMPLANELCIIDCSGDATRKTATVTIKKEGIIGDIEITGIGISNNNYFYYIPFVLGATVEVSNNNNRSELFGIMPKGDPLILTIKPENLKETGYVRKSDILIEINGTHADIDDDVICYTCSEHSKNVTLTIYTSTANEPTESIIIVMRSHKAKIITSLTWSEISYLSNNGYAKTLFDIGDTKKVILNNGVTNYVRIIGFDHDYCRGEHGGYTAGLTFEFVYLMSPDIYRKNYDSSDYNDWQVRNIDLLSLLPTDLQNVVAEAIKEIYNYDQTEVAIVSYFAKLFPLSMTEVFDSSFYEGKYEGKYYEYYRQGGSHVKYSLDYGLPGEYWLRTPIEDGYHAVTVSSSGGEKARFLEEYCYIAPGFCI